MKLVRQVLGDWKVGKNCKLALNCVNGVMKVTLSADLGSWVQPQPQPQHSETGDRGHQGPRKRAGPSHLRHGNQAPRRGGCQPRRREVEPGTLAPSSSSPAALPAAAATATAPAPARRARRRGPGALLRDERRLARIEPDFRITPVKSGFTLFRFTLGFT